MTGELRPAPNVAVSSMHYHLETDDAHDIITHFQRRGVLCLTVVCCALYLPGDLCESTSLPTTQCCSFCGATYSARRSFILCCLLLGYLPSGYDHRAQNLTHANDCMQNATPYLHLAHWPNRFLTLANIAPPKSVPRSQLQLHIMSYSLCSLNCLWERQLLVEGCTGRCILSTVPYELDVSRRVHHDAVLEYVQGFSEWDVVRNGG